jgi:AcrR family transcriptional regulator
VLEVATDLMARRGYAGTTISAISKAAGVMPASIYWHFESKEGLLAAVIDGAADAYFRGAIETMERADASGDEDQSRLAGLRYAFEEQPEFQRVLLLIALERREHDDLSLDAVRRVRARCVEFLAARIGSQLEIDDPDLRQRVAERMAAFGMVLLDGFFIAHQVDYTDARQIAERFAAAMELARTAILAQEGIGAAAGAAR